MDQLLVGGGQPRLRGDLAGVPRDRGAVARGHPVAEVQGLQNGTEYICRTYAQNAVGQSEASPASAAVKPCASFLDCNGLLLPVVGILGTILALGLLAVAIALFREGRRGYVLAVVDVVHTANIGHVSNLGVAFVHSPETRKVTGIVAERGRKADIRIRRLRHGRFEVKDKTSTHTVDGGDTVVVVDSVGGRHSLTLQAFSTNAASRVATRR